MPAPGSTSPPAPSRSKTTSHNPRPNQPDTSPAHLTTSSYAGGQNHYRVTLSWLGLDTRGWHEITGAYGIESPPAGLGCALSHLADHCGRTRGCGREDRARGN